MPRTSHTAAKPPRRTPLTPARSFRDTAIGEIIAVKQVEIPLSGKIRRYSWKQLEDDAGFLTDKPLPAEEGLTPVARQHFYEL